MKQKGKKTVVKRNTSIHINGKRYDALTGNLLHNPIVPRAASKSIDGISKAQVAPAASTKVIAKPLPASQVPRSTAAHAKAHQVTASKTLMRHAVAKPAAPSLKRRAKAQSAVAVHTPAHPVVTANIAKKVSIHGINKHRASRAAKAATSPRIAHYAHEFKADVEKAMIATEQAFVVPETPPTRVVYRTDVVAPAHTGHHKPDIFEQALLRATSHEQPAPSIESTKKGRRAARSLRRRMVSYGAGAMAVLAIAGFLSFTSSDAIKFRMAARSAGFSATMPSYKPQDFSVGSIRSIDGYVNINYVRNNTTGARSFAVTQKATTWDNQTLLANISDNTDAYNILQTSKGSVYVYGRNQAAWVRHGVLYQVLGNGALNTNDFGQIASSM